MDDVRDGVQGLFRVRYQLSPACRAERPTVSSVSGPGRHPCGETDDGQTFPGLSALGIVVGGPCFIYVIRIFNGCN